MRDRLRDDPKVIAMADWLLTQPRFVSWALFLEPVVQAPREAPRETSTETSRETQRGQNGDAGRNDRAVASAQEVVKPAMTHRVASCIVVASLLRIWGNIREQATQVGEDMVFRFSKLETISRIVEVPKFGEAMASVGWAIAHDDGSVVFPKCAEFVTNAKETRKSERQKAWRDRQRALKAAKAAAEAAERDATRDVTEAPRDTSRETSQDDNGGAYGGATRDGKKRREEKRGDISKETVFPPSHDVEEFRKAWSAWYEHKRETRQRFSAAVQRRQLEQLFKEPVAEAIDRLNRSRLNNWQGLWFSDGRKGGSPRSGGPGSRDKELIQVLKASAEPVPASSASDEPEVLVKPLALLGG